MEFPSLFENKAILGYLDRPQLVAICKLIGISSMGPDCYLRFIFDLKLHHLITDSKLLNLKEVENLSVEELQAAGYERRMGSICTSIERLRLKLQQ